MNWPDDFVNKIICGDCLNVLQDIPTGTVNAVITDPPYGFDRFKGDEKEFFIDIIKNAFVEINRILMRGGWAFVFSGTGQIKNLLNSIDLDFQRMLWMYKPADCTYPYRGWLLTSEAIAVFSNGSPHKL